MTAVQMKQGPEKEEVRSMFNAIAARYDAMNHLLSGGFDILWRSKAVRLMKREIEEREEPAILDVATGTGDLVFQMSKVFRDGQYVGIDIAENMLLIANEKMKKKEQPLHAQFIVGDAEAIAFPDNKFDVVTCAFGTRNFQNLSLALTEFKRVLKQQGLVLIIEFCWKNNKCLSGIMRLIISTMGRLSNKKAYRYLPDSVDSFYSRSEYLTLLDSLGYKNTRSYSLFFGVAAIYLANK